MTIPLPQIVCEGCGACCRHVGTPPGFYPAYAMADHDGERLTDSDDWDYWRAMPADVRQELTDYYRGLHEGRVAGRDGVPCLWLDEETGRCRHYEFRPQACREVVQPGDESCLAFRAELGEPGNPTPGRSSRAALASRTRHTWPQDRPRKSWEIVT